MATVNASIVVEGEVPQAPVALAIPHSNPARAAH